MDESKSISDEITLSQAGQPITGASIRPAIAGERIAQRYRLQAPIGQGGLGSVHQAVDEGKGVTVAIKLLRLRKGQNFVHARTLLEREYHTLRELAHPSIIEVYDYGFDIDGRPYYTMELLSGQDLRELAPLHWREVCRLLIPVASSLAVLHSRKLLHRDVSARNVRRTADGQAKLLDFGSMGSIGVAKEAVGTPPYLAPEAVHGQPLDARTDLYAFGALLYLMLTGRHAFPANRVAQLRDRWRSPLMDPRRLARDMPEALAELVVALLALDPASRPTSAAEVMVRLGAIAGLPTQEDPAVYRAYLTTPRLVAREQQLLRVRRLLLRARRGRGGGLYIEAASGLGRSRMLDACMLEAQLAGGIAVRADMGNGGDADFSTVFALARQLCDALPDAPSPPDPPGSRAEPGARAELQSELLAWLLRVNRDRLLVLLVDDYHGIDEASAALIATLTDRAELHNLVVVVTAQEAAAHTNAMAWEVLTRRARPLQLQPLSRPQCERLLTSIFGEVPHVRLLSARLHGASKGNPRTLMELTEQLVDAGLVHYEAGHWVLPDTLEEMTPDSAVQRASAQVRALSAPARDLAHALSLAPDLTFDLAECSRLCDARDAELFAAIEELLRVRIIARQGGSHRLAHNGYSAVLLSGGEAGRGAQRRLAEVLRTRANPMRAAVHWMSAGEERKAVESLLEVAERSSRGGLEVAELAVALRSSAVVRSTLDSAIEVTDDEREKLFLRLLIVDLGVHAGPELLRSHLPKLLERLAHDCGLSDYCTLEGDDRLQRSLAAAQARFDAQGDDAGLVAPAEAMRLLTRVCLASAQSSVRWFDYEIINMVPSLQPLSGLSPGLWVAQQMLEASRHVIAARYDASCECYRRALERLSQPDRAGLDVAAHTGLELWARTGLGLVIAGWSAPSALIHADHLDASPHGRVLACHIRALYNMSRGDSESAEGWERQAELLEIQRAPTELTARRQVHPQLIFGAYSEDLMGIKQTLGSVREMAQQAPAWRPILRFAEASYDHLRGDQESALKYYDEALELALPGRHPTWPMICERKLWLLLELDRLEDVIAQGDEALRHCDREGIARWMVKPVAIAHALRAEHAQATQLADEEIARWEDLGGRGLHMGRAYETRARVALYADDGEGFGKYAALCAQHFLFGGHSRLHLRYDRLLDEARRHGLKAEHLNGNAQAQAERANIRAKLVGCGGSDERTQVALKLLLEASGLRHGVLYRVDSDSVRQLAANCSVPAGMVDFVRLYAKPELEESTTLTQPEEPEVFEAEDATFQPVLLSAIIDEELIVVGVLMLAKEGNRGRQLSSGVLHTVATTLAEAGDFASLKAAI
ncbi:MAG: protein kinase [Myxococcales bacterium]|nr:protein kinase [Myxococcales bacterium]